MFSSVQNVLVLSWIHASIATAPSMKMYFHGGINDYMMFKNWVPEALGSYMGAWFLFFFLGVGLEGFLVFAHNTQLEWMHNTKSFDTEDAFDIKPLSVFSSRIRASKKIITVSRAFLLAVFRFIESGLAYFLMLVTMIFNIGLFFSVISGHAFGVFLFSRFRSASSLNIDSDPAHTGLSAQEPVGEASSSTSEATDSVCEPNPTGSPKVIES
ncbi:hypothetical protein DSO57_1038351 [Entomophthora muscae]|uniref:Uncharacterized protein n=1 Tax=Entomophthora muscae TaxID=34485 RepID=A0ACC2RPQ9_9FUNG|nr:hypothetical protein DSO57_1038351 [Entomophthora muscae]